MDTSITQLRIRPKIDTSLIGKLISPDVHSPPYNPGMDTVQVYSQNLRALLQYYADRNDRALHTNVVVVRFAYI